MTLKEIRDWLKPKVPGIGNAYIGRTDPAKEKSICVYGRASSPDTIAVGGLANTSTATKGISILVQWSKDPDAAEVKAKSIYDIFKGTHAVINGTECFFNMLNNEPVPVGINDKDIYEYVIDLNIVYKRG
ncbi:MAG TPA: hypothetical protein GXX75_23320 [Clostridiales bacterium]|nr:hypothetical protein [Clostridiales bacterium]